MSTTSAPMTLVTGDLPFSGHTITSLCRRTSERRPSDTCIVKPSASRRESTRATQDVQQLGSRHIIHLGNNPYSVPLVSAMRQGWSSPTVVLHDVWLFDLVEAWGETRGESHLALRVLTDRLGVRAGRQALHFRAGQATEPEVVTSMASCLISAILAPQTRVIVHRGSALVYDTLTRAGLFDVHQAVLPQHYAMTDPTRPVRPARWDIAVSGTGSFARRMPVIVEALDLLSRERSIRALFVGGMSRAADTCRLATRSTLDVVPTADDETWSALHAATRVGIRLGVGHLGEGSGLVRDYLAHGMAVVTDDDEPPIRDHPAVQLVSPDAGPEQIACAVLAALASPDVPPALDDLDGLDAYSASMHAALDQPRGTTSGEFHE